MLFRSALDAAQRLQLAVFLDHNARPENADYRYDYFRDNCSTRVRDALDRTLGGALGRTLRAQAVPVSYRSEATRLMRPILPLALGMDLIVGPAGDAPMTRWEQSFVPEVLMKALAEQPLDGAPLVAESRYLLADSGRLVTPTQPLHWTLTALALGLMLGVLLLLTGRSDGRIARVVFVTFALPLLLLAGFAGLIQLAAWTLTEHWVMHANANLLLFSPLAFGLLIPVLSPAQRGQWWVRRLSDLLAAMALLAIVMPQHNAPWIALWAPIAIALLLVFLRPLPQERQAAATGPSPG